MPEIRGLAAMAFGGLPLFSHLIDPGDTTTIIPLAPMLPNKIRFVLNDAVPACGIVFQIPDLSFNEQEVLERAILQTYMNFSENTVLDVPDSLARKFPKAIRGKTHTNSLVFRANKLRYGNEFLRVTVPSNTGYAGPYTMQYVGMLSQMLYGAVHLQNSGQDAMRSYFNVVRSLYPSIQSPRVGYLDQHVTIFQDGIDYTSYSTDFLSKVCHLLNELYTPYTKVEDFFCFG